MPEEFAPEWEYSVGDPEIVELLEEELERKSRRICLFPFIKNDIGRFRIDGLVSSRPDWYNTHCGPEKLIRNSLEARQCLICRELFYPADKRRKCCSIDCRTKYQTLAPCPVQCDCGKIFYTRSKLRKYCSISCRRLYGLRGNRFITGIRGLPESRSCKRCGNLFKPKANRNKFCGIKCGTAGNGRPRELQDRICINPECAKLFRPVRDARKACSAKCGFRARSLRAQGIIN